MTNSYSASYQPLLRSWWRVDYTKPTPVAWRVMDDDGSITITMNCHFRRFKRVYMH